MPIVRDFRNYAFLPSRIDRCGRDIGKKLYWKLYAIENTVRIAIHSVLNVQIGANWWAVAVDQNIAKRAQNFRKSYTANPRNASPGAHDIHMLFLPDLTEILRANSNLFIAIIPTTDTWIKTLEGIRIPRNLVGHMNFPNAFDRGTIDNAYSLLPSLLNDITTHRIQITIPK
jgi:hypothetical protein